MNNWRITIEPINPDSRSCVNGAQTFECESAVVLGGSAEANGDKGRLVSVQAAALGSRQLIAHSLFAYIRDASNTVLRSDLIRLMLADMMGAKPCKEVERRDSSNGMPDMPNVTDELLAALFDSKHDLRN